MSQFPVMPGGARPAGARLTLGAGWIGPGVVLALLLSMTYLPAHAEGATGADGLIATIAALYVLGSSVALVRLARGAVLRAAGSREPIALLGSGANAILDGHIGARWRLSAVAFGVVAAVAAATAAALIGETTPPTTYAHALANLALIANLALVGGVVIPAPGFTGWALVLAAVDARGATPDARVHHASRLAQTLGVPVFFGLAIVAWLLGDATLAITGLLIAMLIRMRSRLAEGHDAVARVLRDRVVGEFARPIVNRVEGAAPLAAFVAQRAGSDGVTAVERGGALIGAIGPRQLARLRRDLPGELVATRMVALADIQLLSASSPAASVVAAMARHGFAFVRQPGAFAYVEADDVLGQILAGLPGPAGRAGTLDGLARSGLLGQGQGADDDHHDPCGDGRQR